MVIHQAVTEHLLPKDPSVWMPETVSSVLVWSLIWSAPLLKEPSSSLRWNFPHYCWLPSVHPDYSLSLDPVPQGRNIVSSAKFQWTDYGSLGKRWLPRSAGNVSHGKWGDNCSLYGGDVCTPEAIHSRKKLQLINPAVPPPTSCLDSLRVYFMC